MKSNQFASFFIFFISVAIMNAQDTNTNTGTAAGNTGSSNSSFGYQAGDNVTGKLNTFVGYFSGVATTLGEYNTFLGANTGVGNAAGKDNVFVGYKSGYTNGSGEKNVFIGRESGYANSGGSLNVFTGYESGHNNFNGIRNTFAGAQSGFSNTSGSYNVFSGYRSGYNNLDGFDNIFSGYYAGYFNKSGSHNIFSGWESGSNNNSGSYNTYIGYRAGDSNVTGSYNVFIGRQAGCKETGSNRLYIDNSEYSSNTIPLIYGRFDTDQLGINTTDIPTGYSLAIKGKVMTDNVTTNGNIGIGIEAPEAKLHIKNSNNTYGAILAGAVDFPFSLYSKTLAVANPTKEVFRLGLKYNTEENNGFISFYRGTTLDGKGGSLGFSSNGIERLRIAPTGYVGIGTAIPDEMLTVNGKIHAKEIIVTATVPADYVFQKYYTGKSELKSDYVMPTLAEIENFTKKNNHLPNVPSAKEIQQNGMSLGEMSNILLQKVEELTLYAIEQQKELERLKAENEQYKSLAERLAALENSLKK